MEADAPMNYRVVNFNVSHSPVLSNLKPKVLLLMNL